MNNFTLLTPKDPQDAFSLLKRYEDAKTFVISGGTDLIPLLRSGALKAGYLVDINPLRLNAITETDDAIAIGAACTFKQLYTNGAITKYLPALAEAAKSVGAVQTRGLATIGGNLCAAVPSLDSAPALFVYNAELKIASAKGARVVPVTDFFVGPKKTVLNPKEEILTEIIVKKPPAGFASTFRKFGRRAALTLSIANAAFGCEVNAGKIANAAACVGACAPVPVKLSEAEEYLNGKDINSISFDTLDSLVKSAIRPISDIRASKEYRSELAAALIRGQVRDILGRE